MEPIEQSKAAGEMEVLLVCLLCLLLTIILQYVLARRKATTAKLPPGPARLPIIGNLHNLGNQPHRSLADLAKIHGPLMTLKLGQITTIVASSPAMAKEILQKHDQVLSNRKVVLAAQALDHHLLGMAWLPVGPKWRNLRKICNSHLFNTQKLDSNEELRREMVRELVEGVRRNASERPGEAVDVGRAAFRASLNAVSRTMFSLDLADDERSEAAREFKEASRGILEEAGKPNLGDYFPFLGRLDLQGIQRRSAAYKVRVFDMFGMLIDERLRKRKSESYVSANDMLDTLLDIGDDDDNRSREETTMDPLRIKHLFLNLFAGGTDTTSSTLEWAMAELLRNPYALAKVKEELDQVVGKGNHIRESDIHRLPYLQSIVKETLRLHPAVPLLIPRKAGADVEICGFTVPKGAQILVNAWAIGRDPSIWDDPDSFVPERFLGSEVDAKGNYFELIPFGAGRRICPGLPLATRMLHIMLGSFVHWFDWKLPDEIVPEMLDMEEAFGISLQKAKSLFVVPTPR
ncbi:unnamed protein product [Linum tenue]|uniref:Cytochrome P450 n=1 Tax=Linum tenue TaxID=586396 RepID=A0AAV0JHV4_9ROSI|nr:unnamed protein product [Linum tenue]